MTAKKFLWGVTLGTLVGSIIFSGFLYGDAIQSQVGISIFDNTTWRKAKDISVGDGQTNGLPGVGLYGFDGGPLTWSRIQVSGTNVDGQTVTATGNAATQAYLHLFNGSTWDRARSPIGDSQPATGIGTSLPIVFNGGTYDRVRGEPSSSDTIGTTTGGLMGIGSHTFIYNQNGNVWERMRSVAAFDGAAAGIPASGLYGFNGTSWDRLRSTITNGLQIDVTRLPNSSRSDTFTGTTSGTTVDRSNDPVRLFSVEVVGTGGVATSWDVRLECSLDNANFTQVLQHTQATGNGVTVSSGSTNFPCTFFRSRTAALTLGSATNIIVYVVGMH